MRAISWKEIHVAEILVVPSLSRLADDTLIVQFNKRVSNESLKHLTFVLATHGNGRRDGEAELHA